MLNSLEIGQIKYFNKILKSFAMSRRSTETEDRTKELQNEYRAAATSAQGIEFLYLLSDRPCSFSK